MEFFFVFLLQPTFDKFSVRLVLSGVQEQTAHKKKTSKGLTRSSHQLLNIVDSEDGQGSSEAGGQYTKIGEWARERKLPIHQRT